MILRFFFFSVFVSLSLAVFCPWCGTKNEDKHKFCFECGQSIGGLKKVENINPALKIPQNVPGIKKKNLNTQPKNSLQGSSGFSKNGLQNQTPQGFSGWLSGFQSSAATQKLLNLQNRNISADELEQLNQDPAVSALMNQMKSQEFQKSLFQGLQSLMGIQGGVKNPALNGQIQQLKGLFQMLNTESAKEEYDPEL